MVLVGLRDNWVGCHRFIFIWQDDFRAATAYFDDWFDGGLHTGYGAFYAASDPR
jgi:hypothetical protein